MDTPKTLKQLYENSPFCKESINMPPHLREVGEEIYHAVIGAVLVEIAQVKAKMGDAAALEYLQALVFEVGLAMMQKGMEKNAFNPNMFKK